MATLGAQKRSVVLVPYPYQGHITPMLQLGEILKSRGFSIIVAHTKFHSPDPIRHPDFFLVPLEDNLSGFDTSPANMLAVLTAINESCKGPLQQSLTQLMKDQEKHGQICCIIYDNLMYFSDSVANNLKIPSMVLRTCSAIYYEACHAILRLQAQNFFPLQESMMMEPIPGLHALRYKDLGIPPNIEIPQVMVECFQNVSSIGSSVGVIWNTIEELDHISLSALEQLYKVPIFSIGPFHKLAPTSSTSLLEEDRYCMAWLDKQAPKSVLYISVGSLASLEEKELEETAWGLANSGQPFLWVIRPQSINGSDSDWVKLLPKGFQDSVGERGCIVKWAPQKEVLAHSAVGGFLTHCGWNSTLESLCEEVPLICRPCVADQVTNARYLTYVGKVGLELDRMADRVVIEKTIKALMVENEGKEIRQRVLEMKQTLDNATKKDGSSYKCLIKLTEFINSFTL